MADTGELIKQMMSLRDRYTPTALAFEMDNPYATLASVGPAYATRAGDTASNIQSQLMREQIAQLLPEQRKHEMSMELLKRYNPGAMANANIGAQFGIQGGELDALSALELERAKAIGEFGGAAADLAKTPYYETPVAGIIRDLMGLDPGQAKTLPSIASSAAGKPVTYNYSDQTAVEGVEIGPDGRPVVVKRTAQNQGKNQPQPPTIPQDQRAGLPAPTSPPQVEAQQDTTTRQLVDKNRPNIVVDVNADGTFVIKDTATGRSTRPLDRRTLEQAAKQYGLNLRE